MRMGMKRRGRGWWRRRRGRGLRAELVEVEGWLAVMVVVEDMSEREVEGWAAEMDG